MHSDFELIWHEEAIDDLKKADKAKAKEIIDKVRNYLVRDPLRLGQPLKGKFRGLYRFRFGRYRIIYAVDSNLKTIRILKVGHRKEIYER